MRSRRVGAACRARGVVLRCRVVLCVAAGKDSYVACFCGRGEEW